MGIDEKRNFLKAWFSSKSQQLALQKEETISLDEQVDCIYFKDTFFVIKKANFEQIVGLQEEYKEQAKAIVNEMLTSDILIGGEYLNQLVEDKPSIHKKLIKIAKVGNYKNLSTRSITKMKSISKQYGIQLKTKGNKFVLEEEKDVDALIKILGDYYKKGELSGKSYGTFSGKELQSPQNKKSATP